MQIQHWLDCDRLLIIDGQCHGSVQVDILKTRDLRDRYLADALLWALWTDPDHRGKGTARRMMETAEREAAARGCRTMALTWDRREAATNTGDCSAATNTGNRSAASVGGKDSIAIVTGKDSKAKGALGCWIVLTERGEWNGNGYPIRCVKAFKVDGNEIKAGTWYKLVDGCAVEVE